jgi:hypothetical protein
MTNNSPYFLGFLLFLVSLFTTFSRLSMDAADLQVGFIIRQLGAALLTTIVGLPFRQLLFAYSPAQADQDLFFRTLEEELRRSATEFKRSQAELVTLVQEFIEVRKTLFGDEEKASRRYVRNLEKAAALFEQDLTNYPTVISSAISACAESVSALMEKLRELAQATANADGKQISAMIAQFDAIKTGATTLSQELGNLRLSVEQLRSSSATLPAVVKQHLEAAKSDFDAARAAVKMQLGMAKSDFEVVRTELSSKVGTIQNDIEAIDRLLTDFVAVIRERIEAFR